MQNKTRKIVFLALLAALCCVATMAIPIPTPTGGYLNAGDIVVVFAALIAGPVWGGISAGVGSLLADILGGYAAYAPGTLIAKGLAALITGLVFRRTKKAIHAAICGELAMAAVYFAYEGLILGFGLGAAVEIPGNLMQGALGVAGGVALYYALRRVPEIQKISGNVS